MSSPPVVSRGTASAFGSIMVRGPGQKASAILTASSGNLRTILWMSRKRQMWTIRGLSEGLPLAA